MKWLGSIFRSTPPTSAPPCMFHVGQDVVCIQDDWTTKNGEKCPQRGFIYRIRDLTCFDNIDALRLEELVNAPIHYDQCFGGCSFVATFFRPVKHTNIDSIAEAMKRLPSKADA